MTDKCRANEVKVGDVIKGPDGKSTVIGIRDDQGWLDFNFAEGRGNRCWSGLLPTEEVTRLKRTDSDMPLGFVIDNDNQVVLSNVFEVVDTGASIKVRSYSNNSDVEETSFHKKAVNRLMGNFTYTLNSTR